MPSTAIKCHLLPFNATYKAASGKHPALTASRIEKPIAFYAMQMPSTATYCHLLPSTAIYCHLLPFTATYKAASGKHPVLTVELKSPSPLRHANAICCHLLPLTATSFNVSPRGNFRSNLSTHIRLYTDTLNICTVSANLPCCDTLILIHTVEQA